MDGYHKYRYENGKCLKVIAENFDHEINYDWQLKFFVDLLYSAVPCNSKFTYLCLHLQKQWANEEKRGNTKREMELLFIILSYIYLSTCICIYLYYIYIYIYIIHIYIIHIYIYIIYIYTYIKISVIKVTGKHAHIHRTT